MGDLALDWIFQTLLCTGNFVFLETCVRMIFVEKSIFASSLLDSVRSSDLSFPSLELKTNNEILKAGIRKLLMLVKHSDAQSKTNQRKWREIIELP